MISVIPRNIGNFITPKRSICIVPTTKGEIINEKMKIKGGITKIEWLSKNRLENVLLNTYENLKQIFQIYRV